MARAKAQAKMAGDAKGGGGKEGIAARSGANMAAKMDETAARKAQVKENARLKCVLEPGPSSAAIPIAAC